MNNAGLFSVLRQNETPWLIPEDEFDQVMAAAMTKTLANELGPFGITVNAIHPGTVYTERFEERFADLARRQGRTIEEYRQQLAEGTAIRRMVTPEDIAHVIAFLASPRAAAICGEAIVVNGGAGSSIRY